MRKVLQLSVLLGLAACTTAPVVTAPTLPPPPTSVESSTLVGKGGRPGFCVYKDATGKLIEAKCKS